MASQAGAIRAGRAYVEVSTLDKTSAGLQAIQAKFQSMSQRMFAAGSGAFGGGLPGPLSQLANFAASPAGALTGFVTAGAMFAKYGDDMATFAERAGMSVSALSGLAHAADMSDASMEGLLTGIKKMQVTITEMGTNANKAKDITQLLGGSLGDITKLSPEDQLATIADRIAAISDPARKTAAAVALFGRGGQELIPLLNRGAAGIAELRQEAEAMGLVLSEKDIANAGKFDDAWKRLKASAMGFVRTVGGTIAPLLSTMADGIRNVVAGARAWMANNRGLTFTLFGVAAGIVAVKVAALALGVMLAHPFLLIGGAVAIGLVAIEQLTGAFSSLGGWLKSNFGTVIDEISGSFSAMVTALGKGDLKAVWGVMSAVAQLEFARAYNAVATGFESIVDGLKNVWTAAMAFMHNALNDLLYTVPDWLLEAAGITPLSKPVAAGVDAGAAVGGLAFTQDPEAMAKAAELVQPTAADKRKEEIERLKRELQSAIESANAETIDVDLNAYQKGQEAAAEAVARKTSTAGTFSSAALWGLSGGNQIQEQIAANTKLTAQQLAELNRRNKMNHVLAFEQ
jgi:hypothetical protein